MSPLSRREILIAVAGLMGGTLVGSTKLLAGWVSQAYEVNPLFSPEQYTLINEVAETILPETTTPGAKSAQVGAFIADAVWHCYSENDQKIFLNGLSEIEVHFTIKYGASFLPGSAAQREEFLSVLDNVARADSSTPHYFRMLKELTLVGYFSSSVVRTSVLHYVARPGKFEGDIPIAPQTRLNL